MLDEAARRGRLDGMSSSLIPLGVSAAYPLDRGWTRRPPICVVVCDLFLEGRRSGLRVLVSDAECRTLDGRPIPAERRPEIDISGLVRCAYGRAGIEVIANAFPRGRLPGTSLRVVLIRMDMGRGRVTIHLFGAGRRSLVLSFCRRSRRFMVERAQVEGSFPVVVREVDPDRIRSRLKRAYGDDRVIDRILEFAETAPVLDVPRAITLAGHR